MLHHERECLRVRALRAGERFSRGLARIIFQTFHILPGPLKFRLRCQSRAQGYFLLGLRIAISNRTFQVSNAVKTN